MYDFPIIFEIEVLDITLIGYETFSDKSGQTLIEMFEISDIKLSRFTKNLACNGSYSQLITSMLLKATVQCTIP